MSHSLSERISDAWQALWKKGSSYEISPRIQAGGHDEEHWFRPIGSLPIPSTGPVVLMNSAPWGIVSLNLDGNTLQGISSIKPGGIVIDPSSGRVSAKIHFSELKFCGKYVITRGEASGSGLKMALAMIGGSKTEGEERISQAKDYQQKLSETSNGRSMLNQYYKHNNTYAECFTNSKFKYLWQSDTTNGQTTEYYAGQTSNAATNPDTPLNDTHYNLHAYAQQSYLVVASNGLKTPEGNEAALAAASFKGVTRGDNPNSNAPNDQTGQSVNDVMTSVSQSPPPQKVPVQTTLLVANVDQECPEPEDDYLWVPEEHREAYRKRIAEGCESVRQFADDVHRGVINPEDTEAPIAGDFTSHFATPFLTIEGMVHAGDATKAPRVEFSAIKGAIPEFNIQLSDFPGKLHPRIQQALASARFLHNIFSTRFVEALEESPLKDDLGNMLSLAMGEELGPLT